MTCPAVQAKIEIALFFKRTLFFFGGGGGGGVQ